MKMKWTASAIAVLLAASTDLGVAQQAPGGGGPREDAYVNSYRPKVKLSDPNERIKDDPVGRLEARREQMGGDLTPEFIAALTAAADAERAKYGPDGRGAIAVAGAPSWTNIGPYRSNWIQNGLQVQESDTGRIRTFLVHPTNPDVLYVLTSSGGLWKTTNFSAPRPGWRVMTDTILSTSGGSAALGRTPETIYLGTGDPFDPGVGGYRAADPRMAAKPGRTPSSSAHRRSSPTSRSIPAPQPTSSSRGRTPDSSARPMAA